jgi:hypothetical protein
MTMTFEERFWSQVDTSGGPDACWPWTGTRHSRGYGTFYVVKGDQRLAHRVAFMLSRGDPGPDVIDHECHNRDLTCPGGKFCPHRLCQNPTHLSAKTIAQNVADGPHANGRKTHCPAGHEYNERNTYINSKGSRICRPCNNTDAGRLAQRERNSLASTHTD